MQASPTDQYREEVLVQGTVRGLVSGFAQQTAEIGFGLTVSEMFAWPLDFDVEGKATAVRAIVRTRHGR
jgi:hypothetical protein